jgi:uncharacterized repeat protein (TIGR02543 family)
VAKIKGKKSRVIPFVAAAALGVSMLGAGVIINHSQNTTSSPAPVSDVGDKQPDKLTTSTVTDKRSAVADKAEAPIVVDEQALAKVAETVAALGLPEEYLESRDENSPLQLMYNFGEHGMPSLGFGEMKENMLRTYIREGYEFDGWYTEPDGKGVKLTTIQDAEAYATKENVIVLYIHWIEKKRTQDSEAGIR